jgi:addiction module RelE/StbE family toxin
VRLEWSAPASEDRDAIFDYIEADNPSAAINIDDRICEQIGCLSRFPELGRPGRIDGTRELVIVRTPYIAAYRIEDDTVIILRILHGAQRWPEHLTQ